MNVNPDQTTSRRLPARSNVRVALVVAGVALAFFCAVIVNHLPS